MKNQLLIADVIKRAEALGWRVEKLPFREFGVTNPITYAYAKFSTRADGTISYVESDMHETDYDCLDGTKEARAAAGRVLGVIAQVAAMTWAVNIAASNK